MIHHAVLKYAEKITIVFNIDAHENVNSDSVEDEDANKDGAE